VNAPQLGIRLGGWLFRYRGFLPVPWMLGALWLCLPLGIHTGLGLALVPMGLLGRLWASIHIGASARVGSIGVEKLVHTGPYELTRNPLYLANICIYTGVGLATCGPLGAGAFFIPAVGHYGLIVRFEEAFLERRLGEIYRGYRNRVPRWLGESAPVHAAAPKGLMEDRMLGALRFERTTLVLSAILVAAVLSRSLTVG
jgi:protein-S-isoprenylcysteine O-methyltransferase Ste14